MNRHLVSPLLPYITTGNERKASDLSSDEQLKDFQGYLKNPSKHGAFSLALHVQCSCEGFCHHGRYEWARQYVLFHIFLWSLLLKC